MPKHLAGGGIWSRSRPKIKRLRVAYLVLTIAVLVLLVPTRLIDREETAPPTVATVDQGVATVLLGSPLPGTPAPATPAAPSQTEAQNECLSSTEDDSAVALGTPATTLADPTSQPLPQVSMGTPGLDATLVAASDWGNSALRWGVISGDASRTVDIRGAGIGVKVIKVSWRELEPTRGVLSTNYIERKQAELVMLRGAGFAVVLDIGLHDPPAWVHTAFANSRYVDQHGVAYHSDGKIDAGDANLVFNPELRAAASRYIDQVFLSLGTEFYGVRFGGGRYGELTYPPHNFSGSPDSYWAFDANALARNPVPNWRPGNPSPNGEAGRFLDWYLDALVDYQSWQISTIRRSYDGILMALYPGWGLRPGQVERAVAGNLAGSTSPEINGEVQRGHDFARQVGAIDDTNVVPTTTWLDAPESFADLDNVTPVAYLAELAAAHPLHLRLYGENTGCGQADILWYTARQADRYGLIGMVWYREEQLFSERFASLDDYRRVIQAYR